MRNLLFQWAIHSWLQTKQKGFPSLSDSKDEFIVWLNLPAEFDHSVGINLNYRLDRQLAGTAIGIPNRGSKDPQSWSCNGMQLVA